MQISKRSIVNLEIRRTKTTLNFIKNSKLSTRSLRTTLNFVRTARRVVMGGDKVVSKVREDRLEGVNCAWINWGNAAFMSVSGVQGLTLNVLKY